MSVAAVGATILAGLVLVAVGLFSVVTLIWDDLLEGDRPHDDAPAQLPEAA